MCVPLNSIKTINDLRLYAQVVLKTAIVVLQRMAWNCSKVRTARAAGLILLIRPIKPLIWRRSCCRTIKYNRFYFTSNLRSQMYVNISETNNINKTSTIKNELKS